MVHGEFQELLKRFFAGKKNPTGIFKNGNYKNGNCKPVTATILSGRPIAFQIFESKFGKFKKY